MNYQGEYQNQIPNRNDPVDPPLYENAETTAYFTQPPSAPQHTVVINTQPTMIPAPQRIYKDYLGCSITTLICCCLPIGIAALVFSCKTREDLIRGDMVSAAIDSRTAFTLNMVALGLGLVINITWIGFLIYYIVLLNSILFSRH
ncbi:hypothetical protein XELAEV_18038012mg [Xenopus laevis]|uniref:Synapse differentiation-inducing gene protein 1-like n=1 Tax=Xenopus laevis TaxID=8355 RepID=A0A974HAQ2_XENLA|nr:hypothetical protein XELAEV_18038012mg [Xenopus laevis]